MKLSQDWTIWFTGLSGSGKSTLSRALADFLDRCMLPYEVLDGDAMREGICRGLSFSRADRDENIRRIGYVAGLLNRHKVISIVAAISPYREARKEVRQAIPKFLEVYMDCPLDVLVRRDVKGLYHRALAGEIEHFTGISDPYEAPEDPDLCINSAEQSIEESLACVIAALEDRGWLRGACAVPLVTSAAR